MVFGITLWVLISLLAISLTGSHPVWALGAGTAGGVALGIYLWRRSRPQQTVSPVVFQSSRFFLWVCRYEILLLAPALLVLLFANRLPFVVSCLALVLLILVWTGRKFITGRFTAGTPLDLPVVLLLIPSLTSLYAAVDPRQSWNAVCMLVAGMVFFFGLVNSVDTERKVHVVFSLFLAAGAGIALGAFLVMHFPGPKLSLIPAVYNHLPDWLPRRIHPNYIGGILSVFFPLAFWGLISQYRSIVWTGTAAALTGIGLVITQSRGALLATGVAVILTGAYWKRWMRWGLPGCLLAVGLLAYWLEIELLLGANIGGRQRLWERAVYISQDFPFTGIGMRSFPVVVDLLYPLFPAGPDVRIPHAHNLYLEIAARNKFLYYIVS